MFTSSVASGRSGMQHQSEIVDVRRGPGAGSRGRRLFTTLFGGHLTDLDGRDAPELPAAVPASSPLEVMVVALRLGLTSFGGPVAHLGYFRREYVERRRWLDAATFADLVAMCQVLPGPASSELGIAIGTLRAGYLGGLAAWLGFTLPSAVVLTLFALLSTNLDLATAGWVEGLKLAAVAVVAQAVYLMARTMTPDIARASLAV